MTEWLENIVLNLHQEKKGKNKFHSSVCIAYCLKICDNNFNLKKETMQYLLGFLRLEPDVKRKECPQYNWLYCFDARFRYANA